MASRPSLTVLRRLLSEHRYEQASEPGLGDDEVRLRKAPSGSSIRTLLALFSSDHPVALSAAIALFGERVLDELCSAELLLRDGQTVTGGYRITAADGLFIAHDGLPPARPDYVGGVNPAARTLASLTMRRPVTTALDLCTGSGYQAMLLARHASRVVATDLLPRAVALTRLNAELNGIVNIECREGSLFGPVEGEQFDIIACNPPFIISPDMAFAFRDGGADGDRLSEAVVRGIPGHLAEGGTGAVLVNWGLRGGAEWAGTAEGWLAGSGCDALVLRFGTAEPLAYAALWNAHLAERRPEDYRSALDRWPGYLLGLGFEQVAHCGLVLRKRAGADRVAAFDASGPQGDGTAQLERMFAAGDRLASGEARVEEQRLSLVEGHSLEQRMIFENGTYRIDPATLTLKAHTGVIGSVPAELVPFLLALPRGGTVRQVALETAGQMGVGLDQYLSSATGLARELLQRGLLERAPDG